MRIPETVLLFRIGNPDDPNTRFQFTSLTAPEEYNVPKIHQMSSSQEYTIAGMPVMDIPVVPDVVYMDPAYENRGIRVYLHFMKYYVP